MFQTNYLTNSDKFVVLIKEAPRNENDFSSWYFNKHIPAVTAHPATRLYTANLITSDFNDEIEARFGKLPATAWSVAALDEVYAPCWEDIQELYSNIPLAGVYAVTEYVIRQLLTDRPLGQRSPEIKRMTLMTKPEDRSHDEAMRYWLEKHAPLSLLHSSGMARYVQNHIDRTVIPGVSSLNSFAETNYWNMDALKYGQFSQPDSQHILVEDCKNFRSAKGNFATPLTMYEYIMK